LQIGLTDGGTRYDTNWAVGAWDFIFNSALIDWGEADTRDWNSALLTVRNGEQKIWINNVFEASNTVSITSVSKIDIVSKGQSYWDWIRVRKYTSPEPTTSVGNEENITISLLSSGNPSASMGNQFTAIIYLTNGTIVQKDFSLDNDCNLGKDCPLGKSTISLNSNVPIDKIRVCSKACSLICNEIKFS
jgi:hypothetical protein